jgi:hypothetical protein
MAWSSVGVGVPVATIGAVAGFVVMPMVFGALSIAAGLAYLNSPTWKLEVVVDDAGLEVRTPKVSKLKLAWADVVKVVASPATHTCHVDGGAPERSLLVPGVGAPAPYDIADKAALVDAILAHVAADKVITVERLELYKPKS